MELLGTVMMTSLEYVVPIIDVFANSGHLNDILGKGRKLQHRGSTNVLPLDVTSFVNPITLLIKKCEIVIRKSNGKYTVETT